MTTIIKKLLSIAIVSTLIGCSSTKKDTAKKNDSTEDSAKIQMRVEDGYIQYYDGSYWSNLISTDELKGEQGEPGKDGINGKDGVNGINGINGTNGKNGIDGDNGINGKDGTNGKDGVDGINGTNIENGITKSFNISAFGYKKNDNRLNLGGTLNINNIDKAVITAGENNDSNNVSFLMNENGNVTITAQPYNDWKFVKWNDGNCSPTRTIHYTDASNLVATFEYTKTRLEKPTNVNYAIDPVTKDLTISWDMIENAKNYTVYSDTIELNETVNNPSIIISHDRLTTYSNYSFCITPNPIDEQDYYSDDLSIASIYVYY